MNLTRTSIYNREVKNRTCKRAKRIVYYCAVGWDIAAIFVVHQTATCNYLCEVAATSRRFYYDFVAIQIENVRFTCDVP